MLIAQISDFHIVAPGRRAYGRIDSAKMLRRAIEVLNALHPQPNLVIGSGDLTESGAIEEYAYLQDILKSLRAPFVPTLGNHDRREPFLAVFGEQIQAGSAPFVQYVHLAGDVQVVILDTVTEGSGDPSFCAERAQWLDRILEASIRHSLLVTHHPVFPTRIDWMDPASMKWAESLAGVIENHRSKIIGMTSGHIHRAIHSRAFGVQASSCPSTAHQVALDFESVGPLFSEEAPGFQVHRIDDGQLTTYTASFDRFLTAFDPREA